MSIRRYLTKEEIQLVRAHGREVEEITESLRKGVPQRYFVIEIPEDYEEWCEDAQDIVTKSFGDLSGNWRNDAGDTQWVNWYDCLDDEWTKVVQKEVITLKWVSVDPKGN